MKKKVSKTTHIILLILSFLPHIMILVQGIDAYFNGICVGFFGDSSRDYGWEGFNKALFWGALEYCIIPLFPASFVIHSSSVSNFVLKRLHCEDKKRYKIMIFIIGLMAAVAFAFWLFMYRDLA